MENENEISEPKEIANKFNDYFANIGKSIASEIPISCKDPMAYLGNPVCNSFYLFPTWSGEIETEINNLKSGKSSGPSITPVNILKLTQNVVSKPLEIIFHVSFASGVVPNDFKLANVIPVFKKGSQYSLCSYRPISLLSVFNKLLEKLIYNRLINIDKNSIFSINNLVLELSIVLIMQYCVSLTGFRKQAMTVTILVEFSWILVKLLIP